mmetsp:Transcript_80738/g.261708  ORF Transcript_80738/g.261708 Transcript_80738/m.261708 type:complete len:228 (+) Transcript_80738:830-1513(+)
MRCRVEDQRQERTLASTKGCQEPRLSGRESPHLLGHQPSVIAPCEPKGVHAQLHNRGRHGQEVGVSSHHGQQHAVGHSVPHRNHHEEGGQRPKPLLRRERRIDRRIRGLQLHTRGPRDTTRVSTQPVAAIASVPTAVLPVLPRRERSGKLRAQPSAGTCSVWEIPTARRWPGGPRARNPGGRLSTSPMLQQHGRHNHGRATRGRGRRPRRGGSPPMPPRHGCQGGVL